MNNISKYTQELTRDQKLVISSTASGFALENMDVLFLSFAMSSMIKDLHLSGGAAGLISSITTLGMLLGGIIFGILGDKIGRVKTFSHTVVIFAIATGLMAFTNDINHIYMLRFLAGIGAGGEYGVGMALIAENFSHDRIGKMTSIAAIGGQIGAVMAAVVAAVIIPPLGWHKLFLVGVLPVILTYFIRKHLHESKQFIEAKKHAKGSFFFEVIKKMFSTPRLMWQSIGLTIMMIVQISGYFGLMNWLPTIVQKQMHLSVSGSSLWMVSTIIGMSIGMMTFGAIFDYFGPRRAFTIFLLGSGVMVYMLILAHNMFALIIIGAIVGFFSNGMFGGYGAVISCLYPTEIRSTANNIIVNVGRAIGGFSSVVIGILMDYYNLMVVMGFLSALYLLSFIIMISLPGLKELGLKKVKKA